MQSPSTRIGLRDNRQLVCCIGREGGDRQGINRFYALVIGTEGVPLRWCLFFFLENRMYIKGEVWGVRSLRRVKI